MASGAPETWAEWVRSHKLQSVGAMWATAVGGSFAYNMTRPIPTSLRVIHARIYAQAFTIAALLGAAAVELAAPKTPEPVDLAEYHPRAASSKHHRG